MWEKRYGFLRPQRTDTNIRYYVDSDLTLLRLVQRLNNHGVRISRIAEMSLEELEIECRSISLQQDDYEGKLLQGLTEMDVTLIDSVLDSSIRHHGFESTLMNLVLPFMEKMEIMWLAGTIEEAHEVCFGEIIKRKTIREIDMMPHNCSGPSVIMFLPKGNQQELSHLFLHYFLRKQGLCVTDMGCDINIECATSALSKNPYECILIVNADPVHWQFASFVQELTKNTSLPIIVSGRAAGENLQEDEHVIVLDNIEATIRFVNRLQENLQNHIS